MGLQMIVRPSSLNAYIVNESLTDENPCKGHGSSSHNDVLSTRVATLARPEGQAGGSVAGFGEGSCAGDVNNPYVLAEFQEITAKIAYEKLHPPPSHWKLLFSEERRRMWIGIGVVGRIVIDQRENFLLIFQPAILAVDDRYQHVCHLPSFVFIRIV